ncbi:MAG: hypothetical protein AB3N14_13585 [Flavobacteriaceae bacterium]
MKKEAADIEDRDEKLLYLMTGYHFPGQTLKNLHVDLLAKLKDGISIAEISEKVTAASLVYTLSTVRSLSKCEDFPFIDQEIDNIGKIRIHNMHKGVFDLYSEFFKAILLLKIFEKDSNFFEELAIHLKHVDFDEDPDSWKPYDSKGYTLANTYYQCMDELGHEPSFEEVMQKIGELNLENLVPKSREYCREYLKEIGLNLRDTRGEKQRKKP